MLLIGPRTLLVPLQAWVEVEQGFFSSWWSLQAVAGSGGFCFQSPSNFLGLRLFCWSFIGPDGRIGESKPNNNREKGEGLSNLMEKDIHILASFLLGIFHPSSCGISSISTPDFLSYKKGPYN